MESGLDPDNIPKHIAIIMDGNGRWANQKGKARIFGHRNALEAVRNTTETAARIGVKHLTLYAFSTENWRRPKDEVSALMQLLRKAVHDELKTLLKNNIRLTVIGEFEALPDLTKKHLSQAIASTRNNTGMNMNIALSYSSRWEITEAVKQVGREARAGLINPDEITESVFSGYLTTRDMPDPEIMIRTSGEMRISNFLMWQLSYAELFFVQKLWPDFRGADLIEIIRDYQQRERRFGMTGQQVKTRK